MTKPGRLDHRPRRIAALALAAVAGGGCLTPAPPRVAYVLPVQEFDLPSGLRVAIERVEGSGVVGVAWVVDSGAADDPPGVPGVAHLVEHLLLRSPGATGVPLERRLANLGAAGTNGETRLDRTIFYTLAPRAALEEVLAVVAAGMADPLLGVDEALVAKEQMVVREELDLRGGTGSRKGLQLVLAALAPPTHPLAQVADATHRVSISPDLLRAFVARHYTPEHMTLVVSGDVSPQLGRQLVGALPGILLGNGAAPRGAVRRPLASGELLPNPPRALVPQAAGVTAPELWMAWLLPPVRGLDNITFEVLGHVVSRVLNQELDEGSLPDVLGAEANTTLSSVGGALICRLVLRPSADAGRIQRHVSASVASLSGLAGDWGPRLAYDNTLRATVLPTALSMESVARRSVVRAEMLHDEPGATLAKVMEVLQSIRPSLVSDLASHHLRAEQARSVLLVPDQPRVDAHASVLLGRPTAAKEAVDAPDADESGDDASDGGDDAPQGGDLLAVAHAPGVGAAVTTRLPNGLTLIALRRPGLSFASMVLGFHADPQPGDAPGARDALFYARIHPSIEGPYQRGLHDTISRVDHDSYRESLSMFAVDVGHAFELLADEARSLTVRWPSTGFERWMESASLRDGTPAGRANHAFSLALWGDHVYSLGLTGASAAQLTADKIRAWVDRVRRPANGVLVIVGDIDPKAMVRAATENLGDWHGDPSPSPPPPAVPVPKRGPDLSVVLTEDPHQQSADVRFGCFLPPVRSSRDRIAGHVFRQMLGDELLRRLRLELGISYAPRVNVNFLRGGTHVVEGHVDVGTAELPRALKVVRDWLDAGGGPLPDASAFDRARWRVARRSGLAYSTNYTLARGLFDTWNGGLPLASLDRFPQDLASLTPTDLATALAACRASAVISVIDPGPLPAASK